MSNFSPTIFPEFPSSFSPRIFFFFFLSLLIDVPIILARNRKYLNVKWKRNSCLEDPFLILYNMIKIERSIFLRLSYHLLYKVFFFFFFLIASNFNRDRY